MRLDVAVEGRGLASSRSQAESLIKLGRVKVNGQVAKKAGMQVSESDKMVVEGEQYVSRAALKLASVCDALGVDFRGKTVLDVGSSTGGFSDYALQHGAKKVIAIDVGSNQLHPSLRGDARIELHEQTDIRDVRLRRVAGSKQHAESGDSHSPNKPRTAYSILLSTAPDVVLIDVSFISLREVLPSVAKLSSKGTSVVAMVKPQFEVGATAKHKGVIKNDRMRRDVLKGFETWVKQHFFIVGKADSQVAGSKGNVERFYLLRVI